MQPVCQEFVLSMLDRIYYLCRTNKCYIIPQISIIAFEYTLGSHTSLFLFMISKQSYNLHK